MTPAAEAAYAALLTHGAECLDCREFRDEGGKSTGQCPKLDALAEEYRQVKRDARAGGRINRTCGACHRPIGPDEDCTTLHPGLAIGCGSHGPPAQAAVQKGPASVDPATGR
jgi:hypothetical protein